MRQVALLRGINVGGHKKVPMAELREAMEQAGLTDAATYLQSGNTAFDGPEDPEAARQRVEELILERFGFEVSVVIRTRQELEAVVAANPFSSAAETDPTKVHAFFLAGEPPSDAWSGFDADAFVPEELARADGVVYVHTPDGMGRAKLPDEVARRLRPVEVTARNWRTVLALVDLVGG